MANRDPGGLSDTGKRLSAQDGERIVSVVAHHVGDEVHPVAAHLGRAARTWKALPARSYALEHRGWLYERIETAALIPHMLEAFLVVPPLSCRRSISAESQETEFDPWPGRR
jgi:hypothetical protein